MALNADNTATTTSATANTATSVSVTSWYEEVVITNGSATNALLVQTNGTAVSATNVQAAIAPNSTAVLGNAQPKQAVVSPTAPGSTVQNSGWQGATPQGTLNQTAGGANHTVVSIMSAGTSVPVELVFQ